MKPRDVLLMLLDAWGGRLSGKTKIHKLTYLLSLKIQEDLNFKAYYYGPFSSVVEYSLSELISIGFVEEKKSLWGVDKWGFEAVRYDYELTKEGKEIANLLTKKNKELYKAIKSFVKTMNDLGDPNYMDLAAASKAYFILRKEGKSMTPLQIKEKAKAFQWSLPDIDKPEKILEKLGLVQID